MTEFDALISERSASHAHEARGRRGSDLSYSIEDGIHYLTWHTRDGYEFLAETPDSNLILWHSVFAEDDAPERAEEILQLARGRGLRIYNDLPAWRRSMPTSVLSGLLGFAAVALLYFAISRSQWALPGMERRSETGSGALH